MKKQYLILFIFNLCFCSIYLMGIRWEYQFMDARLYGGPFVLSFLPVLLVYLIIYGCFSYVRTKKLIKPNCLLLFFLVLFFLCWTNIRIEITKTNFLSNMLKCVAGGFISVGVSLFFGVLTKLVCYFQKKENNQAVDTPQPQNQIENDKRL